MGVRDKKEVGGESLPGEVNAMKHLIPEGRIKS